MPTLIKLMIGVGKGKIAIVNVDRAITECIADILNGFARYKKIDGRKECYLATFQYGLRHARTSHYLSGPGAEKAEILWYLITTMYPLVMQEWLKRHPM